MNYNSGNSNNVVLEPMTTYDISENTDHYRKQMYFRKDVCQGHRAFFK